MARIFCMNDELIEYSKLFNFWHATCSTYNWTTSLFDRWHQYLNGMMNLLIFRSTYKFISATWINLFVLGSFWWRRAWTLAYSHPLIYIHSRLYQCHRWCDAIQAGPIVRASGCIHVEQQHSTRYTHWKSSTTNWIPFNARGFQAATNNDARP